MAADPDTPQTAALPPLLSVRVWALAAAFEARLAAELAPLGLSVASFRLIGELMQSPEGCRPSELARRLSVKPPSVTAMVRRLSQAGIVATGPDPDDARATRVRLVSGAPVATGFDILAGLDRLLLADIGPADRRALEDQLDTLTARLGGTPLPPSSPSSSASPSSTSASPSAGPTEPDEAAS